ncbi:hypothetical protein [Phenylobacterium soli]|uniref:Uncharacterized protein n=1 Tax=Phenylobacterium soli TaxID=2170551 RepID=A0A328AM58_9CAUL|nr:hypothetical protein [Phenylobacterium soli]RAK56032.1 hypothetical protein DJ017_16700 [Phenylobacterium soli]
MKTVLTGAGIALTAGLLMGAVAKPDLRADDRPEGPQVIAGWAGVRSTGPFDDGQTFASYQGQLPDYVLGTDWKKSLAPPPELRPIRVARSDDAPPPPEPVVMTAAAYEEPGRDPVFPSLQGGQPYGMDLLPPAHDGEDGGAEGDAD